MLEMAKSAGGRKKCDKPSSLDCTPRFSMGNRSTSFSPIDTILGQKNQSLSSLVAQRNTLQYRGGATKDNTLANNDTEGHRNVLENCHALALERTGSFQDRIVNQKSPNGKVAPSSHNQHVKQTPESSCGSKLASSSRRQHADQTSESLCGSGGSGKPKRVVLRPVSNCLSSGRSTATSPLQFVLTAGSQSGMMLNPEEPSGIQVTASSEIGAAAATVEVRKTSGSDRHGSKRKLCSETSDDQGSKKLRKSSKIAKSEISTLALRELKLLKIDKIYGIYLHLYLLSNSPFHNSTSLQYCYSIDLLNMI
jgi:PHD and RING finger domain-containing protein 1